MTGSAIPDDLRRFILAKALTVPDVEALLLFRAARDAAFDAAHLASRLYVPEARAGESLAKLAALGAVEQAGDGWRYAPRSPELAAVLDALETCYSHHLIDVARLIHSTEAKAAQEFADAFRIRKET